MSEIPDIYSSWLAGCFSAINKLNPLCIVTASDLTVIFLGPAHQKTATGLKVGFPVYDSLKICRPSYLKLDELSLPSLVGKRLVLAPVSQGSWRLQAELIRFSADAYLFACRPVIADVSTISDLGLSFGDLGVCDGTMELIQLMKMTELAREDMSEIVSRLEQTQYRISAALEGSNDGWWQWNLEDKTAFLSPKLQALLGISDRNPEQNEGWWEEFVVPKFTERFATLLRDSASDDSGLMMRSSDSAFEFLRGSEIEVVHFHVRVLPIEFDPSGRPRLIAIALRDVSLEIKQKNSIERLAFYDHLTGLANRRLLEVNIEHFVRGLPRLEYKLAIYLLDLDKFKLLNDSKGHAAGDELLIEVASRLRHVTRSTDCVARLGGDEFVVLAKLPAASRSEVDDIAFQLAEKIRESLARSYLIGGTSYQTTSSIGICTDFDSALGSLTPLDKADLALYEAKSQGRNACYLYSESLGLRHVSVISLAERLDQSIAAGQCHVAFQPIVRLDDRQRGERVISSYEALFRPHGFVETVDRIISVAEDRGKVSGITDFVLARVSRFLASHGESASSSSRVSVNISPLQFLERDFCESFLGKLECLGVDPSAIAIELTEAVLLRDIAKAGQYMQDLRSQGIRFYLDDFGTGFSSIGYLKDLPFDVVKIDKSYTRDIVLSQKALVIVKAIADLVDGLGAKLIVEGVESEEQLELLHGMGCRFMQGFLFPFVDG